MVEPAKSAPRHAPPRRPPGSRVGQVVTGYAVLAVLVLLLCSVVLAFAPRTPTAWAIAGTAVMLAAGELPLARIRLISGEGEAYSLVEVAVLASLLALPAGWTPVLATAVAVTSLLVGRTRIKVLFNTVNAIVGAGLATVVFWALGGTTYPVHPRAAIAGVIAVLVYSLVTQLGVAAVIAAATASRLGDVYGASLGLRLAMSFGNIAVGLFFIVEIERVPVDTLIVLPVLAALIVLAYRGYVRALDERDLWQQLEAATKALQQLDEEQVVQAAVLRAPGLFRAEAAELEVYGKRRGDVSLSARHHLGDAFDFPYADGAPVVSEASGVSVRRVPERAYLLASAALPEIAGVSGVLRLWSSAPLSMVRRDERLIGTYVQAVSSALLNARLYREVAEQAQLKSFEAEHDALTGLANRTLLLRRCDEAITSDRRGGGSSALVLLDLDHFKHVNDTLGHAAGDALLRAVGHRLPPLLRKDDTVARLGGDEFAVLLRDVESPASAMRRVRTLLRTISEPLTVGTIEIAVHASAGIAMHPDDAADVDTLLQRADVAMYHAKRNRGIAARYDSSLDGNAGFTWLAMGAELRQALDRGELEVYFQPQVDLITRRVAGFEALVRWHHPTRGLVSPGEFIPVAEQSGLVGELTLRVLDLACAEAAKWPVFDPTPDGFGLKPSVAVNLSARSLLDLGLADDIEAVLARHHLDPYRLKLEITETTMLGEVHLVVDVLDRLRALGVQIAVDDFGTGYSSLTFLQRVQVNELKIDRSFVAGMLAYPHDAAIVRATVDLARSFGLMTVAEGVEDPAAATRLEELGVDLGQGYWYARPVPAGEAQAMVGVVLPP